MVSATSRLDIKRKQRGKKKKKGAEALSEQEKLRRASEAKVAGLRELGLQAAERKAAQQVKLVRRKSGS